MVNTQQKTMSTASNHDIGMQVIFVPSHSQPGYLISHRTHIIVENNQGF